MRSFAAPQAAQKVGAPRRLQAARNVGVRSQQPNSEIGARDPTPQELEYGFSEKMLTHANTDHLIAIPAAARVYLGLGGKSVVADAPALSRKAAELLRKQALDWRLADGPQMFLRRSWTACDAAAAAVLRDRVAALINSEGLLGARVTVADTLVTAELCSHPDGATESDFVVASRVDAQTKSLADLLPPPKARKFFA